MAILIEATRGTVRASDIRKIKVKYDVYRVTPPFHYNINEVISFLVDKLGARYDFLGVMYLGFLKLFQLKAKANEWQRSNDWFCSELVCAAFRNGGLDIIPQITIGEIASPADIANSERLKFIVTKGYMQ